MSPAVQRSRPRPLLARKRVTLAETLDRVLNKGAVIVGDLKISISGIDLVYVHLNVLVTSVETLRRHTRAASALREAAS